MNVCSLSRRRKSYMLLFDIFKLPSFKKRNTVFVSTAVMKYSGDVLEAVQNTQSTFLSSLKIRALRIRIFDADKTLNKSRSTLFGCTAE